MTLDEFKQFVLDRGIARTARENGDPWRRGQLYFNTLFNVRPGLAERVRGTELDPFYQDDRIPAFLVWLGDEWDKEAS